MLRLKNAITDTYLAFEAVILTAIDELDDREKYHVSIYPFGIEKKDGTSIPKNVLSKVQEIWKTN
jgi:hypothetical protein